MNYKSIRLPEEFVEEVKTWADQDFRTVPQQIQYWAEIGKQKELRDWQLEQMRIGLKEAKLGNTISHEDVMKRAKDIISKGK
jgi:predicted transcriptional regulator